MKWHCTHDMHDKEKMFICASDSRTAQKWRWLVLTRIISAVCNGPAILLNNLMPNRHVRASQSRKVGLHTLATPGNPLLIARWIGRSPLEHGVQGQAANVLPLLPIMLRATVPHSLWLGGPPVATTQRGVSPSPFLASRAAPFLNKSCDTRCISRYEQ